MVIDTKEELQTKEFLQRADIRTMQKDLKRLREADSLKEREKIGNITPMPSREKIPSPLPEPKFPDRPDYAEGVAGQQEESEKQKVIVTEVATPEDPEQKRLKALASEEEKQQIFLLQSRWLDLQNKIKMAGKSAPALVTAQNTVIAGQKQWQQKLVAILAEQQQNENQQKVLEEKINIAVLPEEKQSLEKQRTTLEEKGQDMEKKRWSIEKALAELATKTDQLSQEQGQGVTQEDSTKTTIANIDRSLKDVFLRIAQREKDKQESMQKASLELKKQAEAKSKPPKQQPPQKQPEPPESFDGKDYLKGVPKIAQEKLAQKTMIEQEQRRKFIEDVEKWARENKQNTNHI